jgi:hypothetical protein
MISRLALNRELACGEKHSRVAEEEWLKFNETQGKEKHSSSTVVYFGQHSCELAEKLTSRDK